jgi:signal peptidase I
MSRKTKRWFAISLVATAIYGVGNLYSPTVVVGESMSPTLRSGRVIWIDRTYYRNHTPERGEVVVFKYGEETYVKRVYRGPGELLCYVAYADECILPIRESRADDARLRYANLGNSLRIVEERVPEGSVWVLGDNFLHSEDSRELGAIPISSIIGRAHLNTDSTKLLPYEFAPRRVPHEQKHADARGAGA